MDERVQGAAGFSYQFICHPGLFAARETQDGLEPGPFAIEPRAGLSNEEVEVIEVFLGLAHEEIGQV